VPDEGAAPQTISHYTVGAVLGAGGMGAVYHGTDRRDGSTVAIKILAPQLAQDESFRERFEREAHVGALLRSPYVVRLLDHGFEGGRFFIVMEYIEGETLRDAIARGALEPARALKIATQCARALEEAEARGVVHRDIKPENILIGPGGTAKVADFGIAKQLTSGSLTTTGSFVGTLSYAAPERTIGRADNRSDIYSLGATLFHALAGQPPFKGDAFELLRQHAEAPPPLDQLPELPQPVRDVIAKCMAKDPQARYQSATELAGALEAAAAVLRPATPGPTIAVSPAEPAAEPEQAVSTEDAPTMISPPGGIPVPPPQQQAEQATVASGEAPTQISPPGGIPVPQAQAQPSADGGATPAPPAPPKRPGGTPPWVPFFGTGVAIAAVVGALFLLGVIGGGDDDDDGPTFTFDPFTETFPPFTDFPSDTGGGGFEDGDTADNPVVFGDSGVVAGRMDVIIYDTQTSEPDADTIRYLIRLDVVNAGSSDLDVFFEPYYYMIGYDSVEYDEFAYGCDDVPDRITGVIAPGDGTLGDICFELPAADAGFVLYIELDGDRVFFQV
jgi:serine/threonine-protein kinase